VKGQDKEEAMLHLLPTEVPLGIQLVIPFSLKE